MIYPDKKVILSSKVHTLLRRANDSVPIALGDGGAFSPMVDRFRAGVPTGEGNFAGSLHLIDVLFGLHTIDGVRGIDIK